MSIRKSGPGEFHPIGKGSQENPTERGIENQSIPQEGLDNVLNEKIKQIQEQLVEQANQQIKSKEIKDTNPKDGFGSRKVPIHVVPFQVLTEIALGMAEGSCKYGAYNYREAGVRFSIYYDATMRHLGAFNEGQDIDPASGLNHITKALSSLTVLRDAMLNGMWADDRPIRVKNQNFIDEANTKTEEILDRFPVKKEMYSQQRRDEGKGLQ